MKTRILLFAIAAGALLAGCASPANPRAMVPASVSLQKKCAGTVSVVSTGGQKTNPLWTSQVSNEDFATALRMSIERHGLFSKVIQSGTGDYRIDVRLIRLRQPMIGFNMTVQAEIEWRLTDARTGRTVWTETTNNSFTATVGDAFAGIARLRLANEGAIRENIKTGLEHMSARGL